LIRPIFGLLPSGQSTATTEEAAMLAAVFAEDGELTARPAGTSTWSADFGHHHNTTGESARAAAAAIKNMSVDSKKFLA
jgi:hypothetical protein